MIITRGNTFLIKTCHPEVCPALSLNHNLFASQLLSSLVRDFFRKGIFCGTSGTVAAVSVGAQSECQNLPDYLITRFFVYLYKSDYASVLRFNIQQFHLVIGRLEMSAAISVAVVAIAPKDYKNRHRLQYKP
ncbi:hypothetical protein DTO164E3_2027 [Paecilomyces variotii]|nr:hypothetical protein DTO164E3_2027 [Paecilomyces variotii]KAJ9208876.1 hypothetical protein DTO032I3_93 [Paecilomyces variotii]KAJ9282756.1 hypothetical protein DTO021D3_93 [Paecilomyces variotii]KAJ9343997.1 hypothetical protein DTO027B6_3433 [Paecilomyces variotii]KAJ9381810.1 hypothetical protein DTO032I4_6021 [Paecilomyces variotii]